MEAIVLAGGFGTRLRRVVSDVPKPMAPVAGKPFLSYLLDDLQRKGIHRVVLAVGYKSDVIYRYYGDSYEGITLSYSFEDTPLLTGGAIKKALQICIEEQVFVLNGDSFFDVNLQAMRESQLISRDSLVIAVKPMKNFDRYGTLVIEQNHIKSFREKKHCDQGFISGGIYSFDRNLLAEVTDDSFSFETDFMTKRIGEKTLKVGAFASDGYFIDIGIPEDYFRAQTELPQRVGGQNE